MIDIKDISGNTILSVPITPACERIEELMQSDHAVLSWNSDKNNILPLGAYIEYKGERLSLLEPYSPEQKDELEYLYKPLFHSKIMVWEKTPFFMYTRVNGTITSKEADWTLTDNPANFMATICDVIKNETGETWTYAVDASLLASTSLPFQSVDIFSALNQIANAFGTEWWADKVNKVIHLSKASHGTAVALEVGVNIKPPTITSGKQGYFTRFYAFGSTRNITQDYKGANVNNLINKRLTLDPVKFPNGYKDIRPDLKQGEVFSKVLVFDDIYPSSKMLIADVRSRPKWVLNEGSEKVQVGTDSEGNPIYDQCAIWYFQIPGFVFNNTKYDKEKNPDGMLIEGKNCSVRFESGPLSGREFEFFYHDEAKTVTTDGLSFQVKKGDFEIKYIQEENYIIPDMTALVPVDGNDIVLFNVKMPSEYTASAYTDLENTLDKEMERLTSDLNNYQFDSNPVSFQNNNPDLSIGRIVTYKNGSYSYSTRVIKLTTKMDYDCEQNITIGNEQTKGTVQELKEEVVSANKDLNLLQAFNDMTSSLHQSYTRTQQMMLEGFASIKNIWQLKEDEKGNKYAQSAYHIVSERGATFNANESPLVPSIFSGLPIDQQTLSWVDGVLKVVGDIGGGIESAPISGSGNAITDATLSKDGKILSLTKGATFLTKHQSLSGYATETWVNDKGYVTTSALKDYVTLNTDQDVSGIKAFTGETTAFKGITIGGVSIKKSEEGVLVLEGDLLITGGVTFFAQGSRSAATIMDGVAVDGTTIIKESGVLKVVGGGGSGLSGIKVNGETFLPDADKFITLPIFRGGYDSFGKLAYIGGDGVMEVGTYIDFHAAAGDGKDYDVRLQASPNRIHCTGNIGAAGIIDANGFVINGKNGTHLLNADGGVSNFNWDGQGGQPAWLWGGNAHRDYYVYNPSNFNVETAASLRRIDHASSDDSMSPNRNYAIRHWALWNGGSDESCIAGVRYNVGMSICGVDNTKYGFQLGVSLSAATDTFYYKGWSLNSNSGWRKVLHDGNWTSIVDGRYLPLTGGVLNGKLHVDNKGGGASNISLAIGDHDTGLNWRQDGVIDMYANGVKIGYWNHTEIYSYNGLYGRSIQAYDGLFTSVCNGHTVRIGSQNPSHCHFETSAPAFYFNKGMTIAGNILSYDGAKNIGAVSEPFGTIYTNNWLRSIGATGWYNETYNGGIYMIDSTWIRIYNAKKFHVSNGDSDAINCTGGYYSSKQTSLPNTWTNILEPSHAIFNLSDVHYVNTNTCRPILGWIDQVNGQGDITRYSISSIRHSSRFGSMVMNVGNNNSGTSGNQLYLWGDGEMMWTGNFLTQGGITMNYTSDLTLKKNVRLVIDASKRLMSLGGIYDFEYINEEVERNSIYVGEHIGLIYQNVKDTCMRRICHEREDGKGSINYIDTSFVSLLAAVGMEHETRLQAVERQIKELERRVA